MEESKNNQEQERAEPFSYTKETLLEQLDGSIKTDLDLSVEDQLALSQASRNNAESERRRIASGILDATRVLRRVLGYVHAPWSISGAWGALNVPERVLGHARAPWRQCIRAGSRFMRFRREKRFLPDPEGTYCPKPAFLFYFLDRAPARTLGFDLFSFGLGIVFLFSFGLGIVFAFGLRPRPIFLAKFERFFE